MAFLFTETGMISRFLLHHVRGHYQCRPLRIDRFLVITLRGIYDPILNQRLPCSPPEVGREAGSPGCWLQLHPDQS